MQITITGVSVSEITNSINQLYSGLIQYNVQELLERKHLYQNLPIDIKPFIASLHKELDKRQSIPNRAIVVMINQYIDSSEKLFWQPFESKTKGFIASHGEGQSIISFHLPG